MKKLFVVLAAMVMTLSASAFEFDGINLNASVNKISAEIAKRGYTYDEDKDAFTGLCRGTEIYLSLNWKDVKEEREKEQARPHEEKTTRVRLNDKRKMTFKEKKEFEELEKLVAQLEQEKADIETALCSGTLSVDELTEKSKRLPELNDLIDEKTMRWLELSEIEG